jgi:hypothetical protein
LESTVLAFRRAARYLAHLDVPRTILWCYLVWYLVVVVRYFDPSPTLWASSVGLSVVIGLALLLNAGWPSRPGVRLDRWQKLRFFLMPFCVSSFAALVKGRGFVLVFSPDPTDLALALGGCALLLGLRQWAKAHERRALVVIPPPGQPTAL